MDLPLAIKEQETIGSSLLASGSFFTGILCPTVYRCSKCQKEFRDRSMEWPLISSMDRILFLFPMVVDGWILLAFVACILFFYTGWNVGPTSVLMLAAIFFVVPLIAWFIFRGSQIARSVHRFTMQGKTKAA